MYLLQLLKKRRDQDTKHTPLFDIHQNLTCQRPPLVICTVKSRPENSVSLDVSCVYICMSSKCACETELVTWLQTVPEFRPVHVPLRSAISSIYPLLSWSGHASLNAGQGLGAYVQHVLTSCSGNRLYNSGLYALP